MSIHVIYIIADIQTVRLNPLKMNDRQLQVSLGLGKRMEIPYDAIEKIEWGNEAEHYNLKSKGLIEFMARDLEEVKPHCIIHFNRPLPATLFLGFEKEFHTAAIRLDEPERFRLALRTKNKSSVAEIGSGRLFLSKASLRLLIEIIQFLVKLRIVEVDHRH